MVSVLAWATRRVGLAHIRHVKPVPRNAATGLVDQVYNRIETEFGMLAPPLALHAAAPEVLAAGWLILRETLLVEGNVSRAAKEAVAAAVSQSNTCPYCVEVHGATLIGLRGDADASAVVADRIDSVADPQLRAITRWARASGLRTRDRRPPTPFPVEQAAEFIGIAVTFHYINRMVNVFLTDSPLPAAPGPALNIVRRRAAGIMRGLASTSPQAGLSLPLLPEAPLPEDLAWATGQPVVAAAWARAAQAIDAGGERSVPAGVRELVRARLADERASVPGLHSRIWLDETVAGLPEAQRAAARLALLIAFASYQVTAQHIADFRAEGNDDRALIELTSWACFAAARQIGSELFRDLQMLASGADH